MDVFFDFFGRTRAAVARGGGELCASETGYAAADGRRRRHGPEFEQFFSCLEGDARQPAVDRESDLVDPGRVQQPQHFVESVSLIFGTMRVRTDRDLHAFGFRFFQQA